MQGNKYEGKYRYQSASIADEYEKRRFSTLKGRLTDKLEKYCIRKALSIASPIVSILEVPCGTGRITEMLLESDYRVMAVDISEKMMKHAKERNKKSRKKVSFEIGDIEGLKYDENSFDLILTIRLLHHIPVALHKKVFQQLHRTTRKWVLISFSNRYTVQSIRRDIVAYFKKGKRYSIAPSLFKKEVRENGFRIVKYSPIMPILSESVIVLLKKETI